MTSPASPSLLLFLLLSLFVAKATIVPWVNDNFKSEARGGATRGFTCTGATRVCRDDESPDRGDHCQANKMGRATIRFDAQNCTSLLCVEWGWIVGKASGCARGRKESVLPGSGGTGKARHGVRPPGPAMVSTL